MLPKKFHQASMYLVETNKSALSYVPKIVRKPKVILLWLKTARLAQITALIIAVTMPSLVPNAIDDYVNELILLSTIAFNSPS